MYSVIEDEDPVRVCVNLIKPEADIGDEMVFVKTFSFPGSTYIPANTTLASKLFCLRLIYIQFIFFFPVPDHFNFLTQSYNMIPFSDYEQQQLLSNRIRNNVINATRRIICYDQPVYDDVRLEVSEYFGLTLFNDTVRSSIKRINIRPMYDQVAILIIDDDGKKCIT